MDRDRASLVHGRIPLVWLIGIGALQLSLNAIFPGVGMLGLLALRVDALRGLRGVRLVLITCAVLSACFLAIAMLDDVFAPGVGSVLGK